MSRRRHLQVVTSDGKDREDACYHRTKQLPRVEALPLVPIERLCLKVLRHICESLACETAFGWETAHKLAQRELGDTDGMTFVRSIAGLLYAIRAERQGEFSFMVADCPICSRHLCEEEQTILELLRAARLSDGSALTDLACRLVGDGMVACVVLAASVLGAELDALAGPIDRQGLSQVPG
ncbi:MAG: hypothetical protein J0I75_28795 [Hyphomicrobium sp.]|nr:hypothetical protein [Hyphomicrobium sp.]